MKCSNCERRIQLGRRHGEALLCEECSDYEREDFHDKGIHITVPYVVTCACGRELDCPNFTNTCECGADYNWAAQRLAPRSQWGEETGESWEDCY